jgi:hypothetical protein
VRSLAFSAARPLVAAVGDEGTVTVWSLKTAASVEPAIEGLLVAARGNEVVVTAVNPGSAAYGKLRADDVIESIADAKGVQRPVTSALDFVRAVRALKVGDNASIKVKGKATTVEVPVGTATGLQHPLFTLWVDPEPNAVKKHEWVGWTPSGLYDASGEASEARLGWATATGDPARPVTVAGANQYRKVFHKRDLLRLLLETADAPAALEQIPPAAGNQPRP